MPEGDTIFRSATRLRTVMENRVIVSAAFRQDQQLAESLVGNLISAVEARGKHLLMHVQDGRSVHSHMGMTGSWHIYSPGQAWRKPAPHAAMVLEVSADQDTSGQDSHSVVCFYPKLLEILSAAGLRRHPWLSRLGPDILAGGFSVTAAVQRMRVHNATTLGEAILNQSILCGIGNVYKSETLFLCQRHPLAAVASLADEQLEEIILQARTLMRRNLDGYPRRTRDALGGKRLWVYNRGGKPCYKCRTAILMRRQGDLGRSTYWCPACQPSPV